MLKNSLFVLFLIVGSAVQAQSYIGLLTDNYSGVHGLISNPANIADSRFKTDINIVGVSTFFSNDYYGAKLSDALSDDFDFDTDGKKSPSADNNIFGNVDVMGPSFMFNLNRKSSLALFTRGRVNYNINKLNGSTIDNIQDEFDENDDFIVDEDDIYLAANAWAEVGITYARILVDKEQHFLKAGVSLKYLQGMGNAYASGNNVNIDYDADGTNLGGGQTTGSITTQGEVNYGHSDNITDDFDDFKFEIVDGATGFGTDLGLVYEWRPNYNSYTKKDKEGRFYAPKYQNKYKLKFGLSLTDLGSINYKNGTENAYDITGTVNEDDFDDQDGPEDLLSTLYTQTGSGKSAKAVLPTALHLNVDYNLYKKFYVNLNTDIAISSAKKANTNRIPTLATITPRYESKGLGVFMPVSLVQGAGLQWGAGFRSGPLYVGSGSVLSLLTGDNSKAADVYLGLKLSLLQKEPKDKDGDGVPNKEDDCPKTSGPIENNGCPWPDTDGDSVLDKDDLCPNEVGEINNNGCPWVDTDGDSILDKDDQCPKEPGLVENNGCPWLDTDGDGILDKDDSCIDLVGTVANNGCPEKIEIVEVTQEVQKTLNEYAKTILFDSGTANIKAASTSALVDIIGILKEYPEAKFSVEGHTDSVGSKITNQKLSESRALSVKDFLIENGIASDRLTSIGYGEDKPLATNMYKDGRAQNRRVEINLKK